MLHICKHKQKRRKSLEKHIREIRKTMKLKVIKRINKSPVWGTLLYWIHLEISPDKRDVVFSLDSSSTFSLSRSLLK